MIAKGFLRAGANVLLTSRSEEACKEAVESILQESSSTNNNSAATCRYLASNVSSRAGCEQLAEQVAEMFDNRLDVLVNNAGTSWGEPLERKSGKANWGFDKVLDLVRGEEIRENLDSLFSVWNRSISFFSRTLLFCFDTTF